MKKEIIKILNVEITKDDFPKLYCWAKRNPKLLEETLISINKASGGNGKSYHMDAVNLENDLEHG